MNARTLWMAVFLIVWFGCGSSHSWAVDFNEPLDCDLWEIGVSSPIDASVVQIEAGRRLSARWLLGGHLEYYLDSEEGRDWGGGLYAKLFVAPKAQIPLNDWLPGLGDMLGLPETVTGTTYIKPTFGLTHADGDFKAAFGIGPGVQIGPLFIEYTYNIIDGGSTDNPVLLEGSVVSMGFIYTFGAK